MVSTFAVERPCKMQTYSRHLCQAAITAQADARGLQPGVQHVHTCRSVLRERRRRAEGQRRCRILAYW